MTDNIERRIREHKNGKTRSTKNRGDFYVEIMEECEDRKSARKREKYWKSGCGKEKLKIAGWSNGSSSGS
ncbi:MAG: GIY-YIG nuclease family protein [Candidatus Moraniibacteriota bacterium]